MPLTAFLYSLSSVPLFAARPFLAALLTALVARFGPELPWVGDSAVVAALHASPAWFQSTTCLWVLAVLAGVELWAARSPEIRQVLEQLDGVVKCAVAMLVTFALLDKETAATVDAIRKAGFEPQHAWMLVVGAGTWAVTGLRRSVVELVNDADDGDDLGLQTLLAWTENSSTVLGVLFLVLFPIAALVLSGLTVLGIVLVRRRAEARERASRVPCAGCGAPLLPHASSCPECRREVAEPRAVGVFGQPKAHATTNRARHAFALVARKRCPRCATRLPRRAVRQACPACERVTFADAGEFERYLDAIGARLPRTLLVTAALGAVPVLGVVPAVIYYRVNLVAGLRAYLPPLRGCATRWFVRLLHVMAVALQPIPVVGALLLPLLCWSSFAIYRRSLAAHGRAELVIASAAAGG